MELRDGSQDADYKDNSRSRSRAASENVRKEQKEELRKVGMIIMVYITLEARVSIPGDRIDNCRDRSRTG